MSTKHRQDIDWFKVYKKEEENPYVEAWWKWWPEVSKTLNILRITGGEPLMHKSLWDLFDKLEADNEHGEAAKKLVQKFGTPEEKKEIDAINKRHKLTGYIKGPDYQRRYQITNKYFSRLR